MSTPSRRPVAVMGFREDGAVRVCSWCVDAREATAWAEARGRVATHGICEACKPKLCTDVIFEAGERCVAPVVSTVTTAERESALDVPSCLVAFSDRKGGAL